MPIIVAILVYGAIVGVFYFVVWLVQTVVEILVFVAPYVLGLGLLAALVYLVYRTRQAIRSGDLVLPEKPFRKPAFWIYLQHRVRVLRVYLAFWIALLKIDRATREAKRAVKRARACATNPIAFDDNFEDGSHEL